MVLLLAAEKPETAKVTLTIPRATLAVKTPEGRPAAIGGGTFDAGPFTAWQIKAFEITVVGEAKTMNCTARGGLAAALVLWLVLPASGHYRTLDFDLTRSDAGGLRDRHPGRGVHAPAG